MNKNCIFCGIDLVDSNISEEHIIQNALGEKLKSKNVICKTCNGGFGQSIDVVLTTEMNKIAHWLGIKRERGETQDFIAIGEKSGAEYIMKADLKPVLRNSIIKKETINNEVESIIVESPNNKKIVRNNLRKIILSENKDKDIWINGKKIEKTAEAIDKLVDESMKHVKTEPINEMVGFKICLGSNEMFRAVGKNIFCFIKDRQPNIIFNDLLIIDFVKENKAFDKISYFLPEQELINQPNDIIYHALLVKSYPIEGLLVGFLTLFSCIDYIMILSDNFNDEVEESYLFDVIQHQEIDSCKINIPNLTKTNIMQKLDYKQNPQKYWNIAQQKLVKVAQYYYSKPKIILLEKKFKENINQVFDDNQLAQMDKEIALYLNVASQLIFEKYANIKAEDKDIEGLANLLFFQFLKSRSISCKVSIITNNAN